MFSLGLLAENSTNLLQAEDKVISIVKIYSDIYDGNLSSIRKTDEEVRITVISSSGEVLKDTHFSSGAENHLDRKEIQSAANGKSEAVTRKSETSGEEMVYYAQKVDIGGDYVFIRGATTVSSLNIYLIKTIPLTLAIMGFTVLFCGIVGILWGERITQPFVRIKESLISINNGKFVKKIPTDSYDEINQMLVEINEIGGKLESTVASLKEESAKLDFLINNINDAVIAVDSNKNICLINTHACELFDCTRNVIGRNINCIEYNKRIFDAVILSIENEQNAVFETAFGEFSYLVTVKNLPNDWKKKDNQITAIILSDITAAKMSEQMRSEFFANASHELKSPLTSVMGFADILSIENTNEKLSNPIQKIVTESNRMLVLIEDMLKLSKLESTQTGNEADINLAKVAADTAESLAPLAAQKNVKVIVTGGGIVRAEYEHIYELIRNLTENAIKYNREGGGVDINISEYSQGVKLKITDTGIGIESGDQSRIFERFYRVGRSRSRATGGSGLGLAIVKHICLIYDADISLKSKIGVGTSVSVLFKKSD